MANLDMPVGFTCVGVPLRATEYTAGAAIYPGDAVIMSSDGKIDPASAGSNLLGVALTYASGDTVKVMVADHPDQLFQGQVAASEVDNITDNFNTADILATAGNSTYKVSRMEVDGSTLSGSATAQVRILGIVGRPDNALGEFVDVVFRINEHVFTAAQANAPVGV